MSRGRTLFPLLKNLMHIKRLNDHIILHVKRLKEGWPPSIDQLIKEFFFIWTHLDRESFGVLINF